MEEDVGEVSDFMVWLLAQEEMENYNPWAPNPNKWQKILEQRNKQHNDQTHRKKTQQ